MDSQTQPSPPNKNRKNSDPRKIGSAFLYMEESYSICFISESGLGKIASDYLQITFKNIY